MNTRIKIALIGAVAIFAIVGIVLYNNEMQAQLALQKQLVEQAQQAAYNAQQQAYQAQQQAQKQAQQQVQQQAQQQIQQQASEQAKVNETIAAANSLLNDYKYKLSLVTEIQQRTDALGTSASKAMYVEWIRRNNDAIMSGETLKVFVLLNRDVLDTQTIPKNWGSDLLTEIATNEVTLENDNKILTPLSQ